jgi:hypothetical protein
MVVISDSGPEVTSALTPQQRERLLQEPTYALHGGPIVVTLAPNAPASPMGYQHPHAAYPDNYHHKGPYHQGPYHHYPCFQGLPNEGLLMNVPDDAGVMGSSAAVSHPYSPIYPNPFAAGGAGGNQWRAMFSLPD